MLYFPDQIAKIKHTLNEKILSLAFKIFAHE